MTAMIQESEVTLNRIENVLSLANMPGTRDEKGNLLIEDNGVTTVIQLDAEKKLVIMFSVWPLKQSVSMEKKLAWVNDLNRKLILVKFQVVRPETLWCDYQLRYDGGLNPQQLVSTVDLFGRICRAAGVQNDPDNIVGSDEAPKPPKAGNESASSVDRLIDEARKGPKRPLLYMFQFVALREAAFENHPELMRELEGEKSSLPLLHFRSKAHIRCIQAGLTDLRHEESSAAGEAEDELFKDVAVHTHKRHGYTAHIVSMPAPLFVPEAHFVAIVHKDGEPKEYMQESPSTRYFTLEKSRTRLPVLCECLRDGSRKNFGEGPAPDTAAFVEAVFARVATG